VINFPNKQITEGFNPLLFTRSIILLITRFRACRKSMLIFKHTILLIALGCRPHITSFCDLWVKRANSQHFTHKARRAVWAAPDSPSQVYRSDILFTNVKKSPPARGGTKGGMRYKKPFSGRLFNPLLFHYVILIAIFLLAFSICAFADDESSGDLQTQPNRGSSIVPQKREKEEKKQEKEIIEEVPSEEEKSENEEEEKSEIDKPKDDSDLYGTYSDGMTHGPPPLDPNQRDLDRLFEQTKQEGRGSLQDVLQQHDGTNFQKPESFPPTDMMGPFPPDDGIMGPPPQDDFVGPPPLPEINIEGMDKWDFIGPPLPEPDQIESEFVEEEIPQIEIEFEDTLPPEDRKFVDLSADKITRDKLNHTVFLEGNSKVVYEDVIILSEFCEFNDDEEWGKFWGPTGVLSESEDGISKSERLEAYFKEKKAYLHENVEVFVYGREYENELEEDAPKKDRVKRALGQDDTTIYCDEVIYNWGEKTFFAWVEDSEIVKLIQDGRYAHALAMYHERETELTVLEGKVELWQKDGDWLFDRDVVTDKEDNWANALLRPETTVTCDLLESHGEEETTLLDGNVLAVQKNKRSSADKVINNDKEKLLTAEGNVKYHHDNGDWLVEWDIVDPEEESEETMEDLKKAADGQADKFILWTEDEDFEAEGNVKAWQEHQEASMDKAVYTKEFDRLQVFGNVKFARESKHDLLSDEGILWLTTKVYEAFGNVKSKGKIDVEEEMEKIKEEKEDKQEEKSE